MINCIIQVTVFSYINLHLFIIWLCVQNARFGRVAINQFDRSEPGAVPRGAREGGAAAPSEISAPASAPPQKKKVQDRPSLAKIFC